MQFNHTHYIAAKDCPYTWKGQNLTEIRRATPKKIAEALKVGGDGSKNELLQRIIVRARSLEAPEELTNG